MGARQRGLLAAGAMTLLAATFAVDLIAQIPASRTIALRNIHTDDIVTVEYKRNGRYVPEAMQKINWVMRDWRRDESTTMDPALVDLLWEMHNELGSKQPINIISAYRSRTTNNMLRKSVGGQASESRHILGKAADVQFPDVPVKHIRYAAMVRERGGVGYYPTSATPFIHVDTDRVRAWPRMPRYELALLFPNGRTQHKPAEGGDITMDDVRTARARQPEVALQLASFHDMRRKGREQPSIIAALAPGARDIVFTPPPPATTPLSQPRLAVEPRLADRPARLTTKPSDDDRRKLTQLVALAGVPQLIAPPALAARPQPATQQGQSGAQRRSSMDAPGESPFPRLAFLTAEGAQVLQGWSTGFVPAPAWDADHPEEAAYRPFPLAPFLSETASIDDPRLATLVHPDLARTGELFNTNEVAGGLKLLPGRQMAKLMWSQDENTASADLDKLSRASVDGGIPRALAARRVQTELR